MVVVSYPPWLVRYNNDMESKARRLEKDRGLASELSIQEIMFSMVQLCKFDVLNKVLNTINNDYKVQRPRPPRDTRVD